MTTKYPACDNVNRPTPGIQVTHEIAEAIGRDYRTLPIFEKGLHELTYKKHYSLKNNEFLQCRWAEYKRTIESRVCAPVFFLNIRNYHFYNCRNRLIPSESFFNRDDYRRTLKPGPGVDVRGQVPIPQELLMKRGTPKPKPVKLKAVQKDEAKKDTGALD